MFEKYKLDINNLYYVLGVLVFIQNLFMSITLSDFSETIVSYLLTISWKSLVNFFVVSHFVLSIDRHVLLFNV